MKTRLGVIFVASTMLALTIQAGEHKVPDPVGIYSLIEIDGKEIPATVSHGADLHVLSGAIIIAANKICRSGTLFRMPSGEEIKREVAGTWTQEGSTLFMKWEGAGQSEGTIKGDTFTMNNEGMFFFYKKRPVKD